ncbi:MAG: O-antigen ligase family protein [Pseudomonadota bacterium]
MPSRLTLLPQSPREFSLLLGLGFAALLFTILLISVMTLPWLPQLVVLLSVLTALFFFTRPEIALLTFFGLRVIFDLLWWVPVEIMSLNVMELFSGAVAGLAAVLFYLELRRFNEHPAIITFIPYVVVILIASLRNLDVREGVEIVARYLSTFLLMFLVGVFMDSTHKRRRMHLLFTFTSIVPICVSLWFLVNQQWGVDLDGYDRLVGGYKNLHNHALMMMIFATMGVFWLLHVRKWSATMAASVYLGATLLCLYFTYVRTAQLGLVVCVGVYLVLTKRRGLLVGLIALVSLALIMSATLQDRFNDLALFFEADVYETDRKMLGSGRWALWTVSFAEYLKYPIGDIFLGLGLGKHAMLTSPLYSAHYYDPTVGYIDPHNDYLSLLYQMGPTAMICYIVFQIQVMVFGLRLGKIGRSPWAREVGFFAVALTCTVFVTNFVSNAFVSRVTCGWYYWGLAGLVFGEYLDTKRQMTKDAVLEATVDLVEMKANAKKPASVGASLVQPGMSSRLESRWPWQARGPGRSRLPRWRRK